MAMAVDETAEVNDLPDTEGTRIRIGDMAREFGVTLRTLRFYEDKGLLNPVRVGTSRFYSKQDRTCLAKILRGRELGFSLSDIKEILDLRDPHCGNEKQFRLLLHKAQRQMSRLQKEQQTIGQAIDGLRALVDDVSERLNVPTPESDKG